MNAVQIEEILATYRKYGWHLHRVLLTGRLRGKLGNSTVALFGETEIAAAEIDAAWFTRDSGKTRTAWELRHLSSTPFALFESFEKNADEEEIRDTKAEMEMRLAKLIVKRNN